MNAPALLLVDLQNDYLAAEGLEPPAGELVERASRLLRGLRAASVPVIHVWTTVSRDADDRMPHWRRAGRWDCVEGTPGHEPPASLRAEAGEAIVHKQFYSAFSSPDLDAHLRELGADGVIIAGLHLQSCVRATALDAYERGLELTIAADAVGTHEPLHAAVTRRYLERRTSRFEYTDALLRGLGAESTEHHAAGDATTSINRRSPRRTSDVCWRLPVSSAAQVSESAAAAADAARGWRNVPPEQRNEPLARLAELLHAAKPRLAERIAIEVGKPVRYATAEVDRSVALLGAVVQAASAGTERTSEAEVQRPPLGTVAQITPWNNPLAIPIGKLAPALRYGNAVVWKPAPAGSEIAVAVCDLLAEAGLSPDLVRPVHGGADTAAALMGDPSIDAVSITGSSASGYAAQAICGERRIPLQAELGGNNAAIVWGDHELDAVAASIAEAGLGAAGQRCTANRRVIVEDAHHDRLVAALEQAASRLRIGDPLDPEVSIGPLVSDAARDRVAAAIERARDYATVSEPAEDHRRVAELASHGAYLAPALVLCDDPDAEIVQEETFGPVIVVQRAGDFKHALELLNGVRQGLVAALFSPSPELRERFVNEARAGILKLNRATADAGVEAPFGGWKSSGIGPPEHGAANRDFYTRPQAIYS